MISFSGSLTLHAGPTAPELPLDEDDELLLEELLLVPLEPELLDEAPLDPLELAPVSGAVEASATPGPLSVASGVFAGSVVVFAPASGVGSAADFVSSTAAPRPSSGDVAQAEPRARSDRAATATMR